MEEIIKWCNLNNGFIMAVLTGVYVIATIVIAWIGARSNAISQKSITTLNEIEQERSRPLVEVRLENEVPWLTLKVANLGQTPAYDVRITTTPSLTLVLVKENSTHNKIGIIEHGIGTLGAGVCEESLVGSIDKVKKMCPDLKFTGTASYRSAAGKTYESPINLDVRYMENTCHRGRKSVHDLVTELEKIRSEINHIATGFYTPHVITEDIEHKRVKDRVYREERINAAAEIKSANEPASKPTSSISGGLS